MHKLVWSTPEIRELDGAEAVACRQETMFQHFPGELLRELLIYIPATGKLFWKERDRKWFKSDRDCLLWNARWAGNPAFTSANSEGSEGYFRGAVFYRRTWRIK